MYSRTSTYFVRRFSFSSLHHLRVPCPCSSARSLVATLDSSGRSQGWCGSVRPIITAQVLQQLARSTGTEIPGRHVLVGRRFPGANSISSSASLRVSFILSPSPDSGWSLSSASLNQLSAGWLLLSPGVSNDRGEGVAGSTASYSVKDTYSAPAASSFHPSCCDSTSSVP